MTERVRLPEDRIYFISTIKMSIGGMSAIGTLSLGWETGGFAARSLGVISSIVAACVYVQGDRASCDSYCESEEILPNSLAAQVSPDPEKDAA